MYLKGHFGLVYERVSFSDAEQGNVDELSSHALLKETSINKTENGMLLLISLAETSPM